MNNLVTATLFDSEFQSQLYMLAKISIAAKTYYMIA